MKDELLEAAYLAGFNASGEGYNGEFPFDDRDQKPQHDPAWCKDRDNALTAIKQARSAPVQEPAFYRHEDGHLMTPDRAKFLGLDLDDLQALYTAPPAAQPTTEESSAVKPAAPEQEPVAYTTGHCIEKAKPGGCQLHNLHCNFPACDRKES
jgi:hypothetical protein